jgi:integrase
VPRRASHRYREPHKLSGSQVDALSATLAGGGTKNGKKVKGRRVIALDPQSLSRYFRQAVKQSMLSQMRLHDLRHAHATLALQAGIHPKVVSERLGRATISITLDTCSHAIPAMQKKAAALIAGLVFAER